ncbi:putative amino acid transporter, transmembrane domain-containing protein [Medicago truncatula]|uniref:Putative amino acid transporter, transmembrane domain-containing protein n=1 Tax=Medicago truncatula TaxID=3880 RepID=G7JBE3_MEDTR|nr:amino acid transporter AVT1H [Medicago truncatula]AES71998.1 transmembrane amino acid transporter family protein [Medicago truncatula]RHN69210.1 putative amino acid transporter, transmembrane domain-containing protein [Medicago truncatula]
MLKSLTKILSLQSNYGIKQRREHDENIVALPVQLANCNVCVEENRHCNCDHTIAEDRNNTTTAEGVNVDVEHDSNADSSFAHAVINMVGMLIGLGQLSTPYAVEKGGWASTLLLVGLGVICAYTSHILGKCLEKNPKLTSYVDIGNQAFGSKGRFLVATFIYMEIFMSLVSYTISLHDNLIIVFLGTHLKLKLAILSTSQLLTLVAVLIALPSLWIRDLSSISFLSSLGILMSLLIFVCVSVTAIFGGFQANNNHSIPVFKLHNIPSISGLYVFGYGGHVVFPDLYKSMKDPSKFTKVSIVSFTIVTALYTSMGFMGAKMFGNDVKSQITLNMPPNQIITKIALWATVLTPMTKYALEFSPFSIQLEQTLPNSMSGRTKLVIRGCVASFLLLTILTLALSVPYFEYVLSLTGSLVSVAICLIFPCVFYMKIFWGKITRPLLVLNITLVIFGVLLGVIGTISSTELILRKIMSHHST